MRNRDADARAGATTALHPSMEQRLFEQLDRVTRALERSPRELVAELELFARTIAEYFADEELSFERQDHPPAGEHCGEHASYLLELARARSDGVGPAGVAFLRAWLVNHANRSDRLPQRRRRGGPSGPSW